MRRHALSAVTICALTAMTTAACTSDPEGPRPGGGGDTTYTQVTQGHLEFQVPAGWKKSTQVTKPFDVKYTGDGIEVQVAGSFSDDTGAYSALGRLDLPATLKLPGYQPTSTNKISVDGAEDAVMRTFSYTDGGTSKQGVWIVATQWPYPRTAVLSMSARTIDPDVLAYVQRNLTFKTYH